MNSNLEKYICAEDKPASTSVCNGAVDENQEAHNLFANVYPNNGNEKRKEEKKERKKLE